MWVVFDFNYTVKYIPVYIQKKQHKIKSKENNGARLVWFYFSTSVQGLSRVNVGQCNDFLLKYPVFKKISDLGQNEKSCWAHKSAGAMNYRLYQEAECPAAGPWFLSMARFRSLNTLSTVKSEPLSPAGSGGFLRQRLHSPDATGSLPGSWGGGRHLPAHQCPHPPYATPASSGSPQRSSRPSLSRHSAWKDQTWDGC